MARPCVDAEILAALTADPRLRSLPLAARWLWMELVQAMRVASVSVLRFGSHVPNRTEIAMLVTIPQSELEANLQAILARGLLVEEADGALACPLLAKRAERSEINRINGLKGGATRRRQAEERRQTRMLLPIEGGGEPRAETEPEANPQAKPASLVRAGAACLLGSTLEESSLSKQPPAALSATERARIGQAAAEAAGLDPVRGGWTTGVVDTWLADGADEATILATIRDRLARATSPVRSLSYFTPAIREAAATPRLTDRDRETARQYRHWVLTGSNPLDMPEYMRRTCKAA